MQETGKKTNKVLISFIVIILLSIIVAIALLVMKFSKEGSVGNSEKNDDKVAEYEDESKDIDESDEEKEDEKAAKDDKETEDDKDDADDSDGNENYRNEKTEMVVEIDRDDYFGLEIKESDAAVSDEELEKYIESDLKTNGAKELNDEYVKEVYSYLGISTVEEYKVEYKKTLESQKRYNTLWPIIMDNVTVISYDSNELKSRANEMYEYYEYTYSQTGEGIDAAIEEARITREEFYKKYCEEPVKEEIKYYYIRDYIAKEENIVVSEEEFQKELNKSMALYDAETAEEFYEMFATQGYDEEFFRDNFLTNKVVQFICENAVIIPD